MHLGVYKPTIMFFGLTNSPVTFQAIMNNILRDLIDIGDIAVFIDDMLVEMNDEKKYDKIVGKVLRRIKENDLYIKPKKYI